MYKRQDYQLRTEKETIAFKKLTEKSVSMYTDQRKVVQKGENGEKEVTYKDRYVNGKLVKTTVDSEKVLKAAVNQKTLVGTLRRVNKIKLKNGLTPISDLKVPSYVKLDQNGVPTLSLIHISTAITSRLLHKNARRTDQKEMASK